MPIPAAIAAIPLWAKLMAALGIGQLGLSAAEKHGQRGLRKAEISLEEKALKAQQEAMKTMAKSKERSTEKQMRELRSVMREQRGMDLTEKEIGSRKEQNLMDRAMVNQLIQAMMQSGTTNYDNPGLTPETTILSLLRR
jgi:hypothetical protein